MSIKKLRNQLFAAIAMVLVASIALGSSTYAWFVNNAQVTATKVNVTATTAYSLMIKLSDGNHLVLLETRDKSKVLNLYTWLREKIKQDKVSTITEDGTIIVSSKGAHWDD